MNLLRDPATQFLLAGALIFGLHTLVSPAPPDPNTIYVTDEVLGALREAYTDQTGAAPDAEAEARLIESWSREEAVMREADALGLVDDDPIIRRRILQKMDTLLQDTAAPGEPSDAELQAWLDARPDQYLRQARVSFEHVYFGAETEGSGAGTDPAQRARDALATLRAGGAREGLGDPFGPGGEFTRLLRPQVVGVFGEEFASVLEAAPTNEWFGPLPSERGQHLVRVSGREAASRMPLDDVRERVTQAWIAHRRAAARDEALARLMERYPVVRSEGTGE